MEYMGHESRSGYWREGGRGPARRVRGEENRGRGANKNKE